MRFFIIILLGGFIMLPTFSCNSDLRSGATTSNSKLVVRLASGMSPTTKLWEPAHLFKKELEKASPKYGIEEKEIQVQFYDQGTIGSERQLLEAAYFGVINVVQINTSVVTTVESSYAVLNLPYLFENDNQLEHILHGSIGHQLLDKLKEHRLQGLSFFSAGFRNMFYKANRCAETPEGLNGLKIRVMESPIMIRAINAIGPSATPIPFSELYQSIRTGVVDGAENSINVFVASRFYEAGINCFTYTQHSTDQHVLIANKEWLNSLAPKYRNRIREVSKEIVPKFNQIWEEATQHAAKTIKAQGVIVKKVKNKKMFIDKVDGVIEQFLKNHSVFAQKLYKQVKEEEKKLSNDHSTESDH